VLFPEIVLKEINKHSFYLKPLKATDISLKRLDSSLKRLNEKYLNDQVDVVSLLEKMENDVIANIN